MTNALASLQALATKQYKPRVQAPKPHDNNGFNNPPILPSARLPEPRIESVEINLDTNEVSIEIVGRLTKAVEDQLFAKGFKWQIASRIWVGDYHNETIKYLNVVWDQSIDLIPLDNLPLGMTIEHLSIPEEVTPYEVLEVESVETTEYRRFKQQVRELQDHLSLDAADLMLRAIDCLHKSTFNKN